MKWREIGPNLRELWQRPAGPMNWKNPIRVFAVLGWLVVQGFVLLGWAGWRVFQGFMLLGWTVFRVVQFVLALPALVLFFFGGVWYAVWSFVRRPFPSLDEHPILALVQYHTPDFFSFMVLWYYLSPFVAVILCGLISVTVWKVWLEGRPEPDDNTPDPAAESNQAATSIPPDTEGTAPITRDLPPLFELIEQGKVLALNMPAGINPALARAVGVMLKNAWLQALLMRPAKMKRSPGRYFRPAVFICDEYQAFASVGEDDPSGDEKSFALTRQCRCIPIVATQSISSLRAVLGSSEASDRGLPGTSSHPQRVRSVIAKNGNS